MKEVWCSLAMELSACHSPPPYSKENKIILPSNQLYELLVLHTSSDLKFHGQGAVSSCILNPVLFSMLKKIRIFVGKQLLWIKFEAVN